MSNRNHAGFPIIIAILLMLICGKAHAQLDSIPDNPDNANDTTLEDAELEDKTLILETEDREVTLSSWEEKIKDIKEDVFINCRIYVIPARFILRYQASFQGKARDLRVSGDSAVLWQGIDEKEKDFVEFYVKGNIRLEWGNDLLRADELFLSLKYQQGVLLNFRGIFYDEENEAEYFLRAQELRLLSTNTLEADNAVASLTPFAIPWLSLHADRLQILPKGKERLLDLENPGLFFRDTKILPLPNFEKNLDAPNAIKDIHFNRSAHRGFAVLSKFDLSVIGYDLLKLYRVMDRPTRNQILGNLDIYTSRGVSPAINWRYKGEYSILGINTWYLYDNGFDTKRNRDIGFYPLDNSNRAKFEFWYLHMFPNDLRFSGQVSWWSDENLLREFFESEFKIQKSRDTFAELSQYSTQVGFRLFYRQQLNEFIETIEYKPQLKGYIFPISVFDFYNSELYLHLDTDFSEVAFNPGEDSISAGSQTNRLVLTPGITRTLDFDYFSLMLRSYLTTGWYDFDYKLIDQHEPDWLTFKSEAVIRTFIYKDFPDFKSNFFNISGLKHIIMPEFSYVGQYPNNFYNNKKFKDFHTYDEIDPVIRYDVIIFLLKNTLFSHRNAKMITFLDLLLEQTFYIYPNRDNESKTLGDLYGRFIMNPFDILRLNADMRFNSGTGVFERWSVGFDVNFEIISFGLEQRYIRDVSVISSFNTSWNFSPVYSFSMNVNYEIEKSDIQQFEFSIERRFSAFAIGFTFRRDIPYDDTVYIFTIVPTGVFASKNISVSSPETPK